MEERKPYGVNKEMKNNDRFKFRAWDKSFRRMIYNILFFWKENTITVYELEEDASKSYLPNSHIELEQCTGLKDKKGKLIYEGDIVKKYTFIDYDGQGCEPDKYLDKVDIGIVYITASKGVVLRRVKTLLTENPYKEKELLPKEKRYKATRLVASRSEVIGNIHENPELLEKE